VQPVLAIPEQKVISAEAWSDHVAGAVSAGFSAIELPGAAPAEWISQATGNGLSTPVLRAAAGRQDPCLAATDPDARTRAVASLVADLERAASAGVTLVVVTPASARGDGCPRSGESYENLMHATLQSLRELSSAAQQTGVAVAIEVAADGFLLSPMEVRQLLDLVNRPEISACLVWDRIAASGWPYDWIRTLRHRIGCVRWNCGAAGAVEDAAAALAEAHFDGPIVCCGPPAEAARISRRLGAPAGG